MLPPPAAQTWDSGEGNSTGAETSSFESTSTDDLSTQVDEESDRMSVSTDEPEDSMENRESTPIPSSTPSKPVDKKLLERLVGAMIGLRCTHHGGDADCWYEAARRRVPKANKARRLFIVDVDPCALDGLKGHYVSLDEVLEVLDGGTSST